MSNTTHLNDMERMAVSAAEAAKLLGISQRHLWALNSSGRLPRPIRFGRAVRWSVTDLHAWMAAGAPERSQWESMRQ